MTTLATHASRFHFHEETRHEHRALVQRLTRFLVPAGRALFVAIFLMSAGKHFSSASMDYARSQGVPMPDILVPLSGLLALFGGLSVLLGYKARFGALLLVMFLVPVTVMMHAFWTISDPQQAMMQQAMFMKNVSMLGGAVLLMHFGAGPISLDHRIFRARSDAAARTQLIASELAP